MYTRHLFSYGGLCYNYPDFKSARLIISITKFSDLIGGIQCNIFEYK